MDSISPAASRMAGQPTLDTGFFFTAKGATVSCESTPRTAQGPPYRSGLRPSHRSADGDGL